MVRRSMAGVALSVAVVVGLAGCGTTGASGTSSGACRMDVTTDEMPDWASGGFSPGARVPHVFGRDDRIVAVLFSYPLVANAGADPENKVLLVAKALTGGGLVASITATRLGSDDVVHLERAVGPGSLDLPSPGCWHLDIAWGDQNDSLDLDYTAP